MHVWTVAVTARRPGWRRNAASTRQKGAAYTCCCPWSRTRHFLRPLIKTEDVILLYTRARNGCVAGAHYTLRAGQRWITIKLNGLNSATIKRALTETEKKPNEVRKNSLWHLSLSRSEALLWYEKEKRSAVLFDVAKVDIPVYSAHNIAI